MKIISIRRTKTAAGSHTPFGRSLFTFSRLRARRVNLIYYSFDNFASAVILLLSFAQVRGSQASWRALFFSDPTIPRTS
jgi:hypothetical protein